MKRGVITLLALVLLCVVAILSAPHEVQLYPLPSADERSEINV